MDGLSGCRESSVNRRTSGKGKYSFVAACYWQLETSDLDSDDDAYEVGEKKSLDLFRLRKRLGGGGKEVIDEREEDGSENWIKYGWTRRRSSSRLLMYRNRENKDKEAERRRKRDFLVVTSSNSSSFFTPTSLLGRDNGADGVEAILTTTLALANCALGKSPSQAPQSVSLGRLTPVSGAGGEVTETH